MTRAKKTGRRFWALADRKGDFVTDGIHIRLYHKKHDALDELSYWAKCQKKKVVIVTIQPAKRKGAKR